ncbi:MAG: CDP-diacylglycerol--glycerol-3-phosphate 3-phosphatidyltransferase [Proteobacteria bacterium]|nr:CDP-diacylglycerol--glycerol-3-phosphate 3-phosphatidyltransferase [Pseudomonadota bacterium]
MTHPYTIPNLLTALRIVLIPVIIGLFYLPFGWGDIVSGLLFAFAGITDTLDGYLARRTGQVSNLGAFLDPVADKLIVATALVLIVARDHNVVVVLTAAVIIGREIAISGLREWMAEVGKRHKVAVSGLGKFKTIAQIVGLSLMLFRENLWILPTYNLGLALTVVAAVLTLWSMTLYLRAAWPDLTARPGAPDGHS